MNTNLKALVAAIVLGSVALSASDVPKTLNADFYKTCSRSKSRYGQILIDPAFARGAGLSWDGQIDWKADERSTGFLKALEASLKGIVRPDGSNKLAVTVVKAENTFFRTGMYSVDITIRDASGKIVAQANEYTFATHEKDGSIAFQTHADTIVGNIEKDLLN